MSLNTEDVTIAILVKDKAKTLQLYLKCIENQTYPKDKINLYIRSNNNRDNSIEILESWLDKNKNKYKNIYKDYSDAEINITKYKNHEWNADRFKILAKIRQDSVNYAAAMNSHYFVVDCDNFIANDTLEEMAKTKLPIVGPYLQTLGKYYSNYHCELDEIGYYKDCEQYYWIHDRKVAGLISVNVIHCTYFINFNYLKDMVYMDGTGRHEYVIFSENCRNKKILQYLDNRKCYGYISFLDEDFNDFNHEKYNYLINLLNN